MRILVLLSALLLVMPVAALPLQPELKNSHIAANVPPAPAFKAILERDLLAYFKSKGRSNATKVEYSLLRDGPTQSGVSYPKYYVWCRVYAGPALLQEGAARLAAIDGLRFEVTSYLPAAQIQATPAEVSQVFPAPLVAAILAKAGAK